MQLPAIIRLTPAAILLSLAPLGASVIVIDEDFTTNTIANWSFAGETTLSDPSHFGEIRYIGATSGDSWGFGPHDGLMKWRPQHVVDSSDQASLIYRTTGTTENASGYTFETTGIHTRHGSVNVRLALQFVDNDTTQWAVSDQSIRTSSGFSGVSPVAGSWDLSTLTFSALDVTNLLAGAGSGVSTSTVLENVTGIGVYSKFEGLSWMADNGTYIDSFTVIPEPRTYAAIFGLMALGLILWRRRR